MTAHRASDAAVWAAVSATPNATQPPPLPRMRSHGRRSLRDRGVPRVARNRRSRASEPPHRAARAPSRSTAPDASSGVGEPFDDLVQVARVGVLKAVERYQPDFGTTFATFAMPRTIWHFRDATWALRVPRSIKDRYLEVKNTASALSQELGHVPTPAELAAALQITVDEVLEALDGGRTPTGAARAAPRGGTRRGRRRPGGHDARARRRWVLDRRMALDEVVSGLPERDQHILHLRYYRGLTSRRSPPRSV